MWIRQNFLILRIELPISKQQWYQWAIALVAIVTRLSAVIRVNLMAERSWLIGSMALFGCTLVAGCAAPYTYYGDGACGPMSVSGRFADQSGCSDCAATAPCSGTAPTPNGIIKNTLTCGSGCGEIYWGEWISDPPDQCDACDQDGNWIGPHCCPPSGWSRFWAGLHGQRMAGDTTDCASCGGLDEDTSQGVYIDGMAIEVPSGDEQNGLIVLDPTNLAAEPTVAAPAQLAERPSEYRPQSRLVRRVRR